MANTRASNNPEISFGGLKKPSHWESMTALYIVIIGMTIQDPFYQMVFVLNGLSASLAHSPYFHKNYPKLRNFSSYIDGVSIYYGVILYMFPFIKIYAFFTMLLLDLLFNRYVYDITFKYRYIILLPSITCFISTGVILKSPLVVLITGLSKFVEEKYVVKCLKIKYHSLWHIFGAHMFKNILTSS